MDGMDLWTSMFSADFDEGENSLNNQFADNGHNMPADDGDEEEDDADEEEEEEEDDEDDDDDGDEDNASGADGKAKRRAEPADDALFDFELEPIVSIAEPPATAAPASIAPPMRPYGPRHSLPATTSMSMSMSMGRPKDVRLSALPVRPTTSQINATDENGLPINYELGVVYICPACGSEYRQQDLWKRHMNQVHQYNTRRGLNFVAIDKLYHRCLECNKHIAMHSRENLLKHKFTHLPFRCTKCYICKREYKYRQDLMVHLRMTHSDEVVAMMRDGDASAGRKTRVREPRAEELSSCPGQEDAALELEPDSEEPSPALCLEDEQSRSSSQTSAKRKRREAAAGDAGNGGAAEICEDYIHYMCPDCGTECDTQAQWSQHIEFVHDYVSRRGLNFRSLDMQMQCIECKQFVQPNTIKVLRQHKFGHLPHQEWLRCKLCYQGFGAHQPLIEHLLRQHHLDTLMQQPQPELDNEDIDEAEEALPSAPSAQWGGDALSRRGGRIASDDVYEPHIDYLCPQCGKEFLEKKHWRTHVVQVHGMNDLAQLNFAVINDRQLKCTECDKIITNAYGIQNAQQHRITHLPHKAYARCRKCHKSYTDRKGLVKHLATYHRVGYEPRMMASANSTKPPRKQLVTVANETYEIIYLDDLEESPPSPENDFDNDFGEQMQEEEPPVGVGVGRPSQTNRFKCVDCGSLFSTHLALKTHISVEHDFTDSQFSAKKFDNAEPEQQKPASVSASAGTIEQNYIFLCPSCGEEYKTQFEWRRHINEAHNFDKRQFLNMRQLDKYRYQCTQCKDIVCNTKLKGLQDHHFRHLPYRLYLKCLVCGTCYNHKPNITAHLRTRHNIIDSHPPERDRERERERDYNRLNKELPAESLVRSLKPNAGSLPRRPAELNTLEDSISYHNAVDLDFITYYCPKCNKNFDSHAFWRKHIVEQHNYNCRDGLNFRQIDNHHYLCLECYKRVTVTHTKGAIGQLQSHKFRHLPYRSFKCLTCGGEFVRKQMFFKHLNRDTNRCDNQPRGGLSLNSAPQPAEEQPAQQSSDLAFYLLCPQCGEEFSTKALWRQHLNIDHALGKRETLRLNKVGEALYQCLDCEATLQTKKLRVLQQHRFQHLPHAAYIRCQLCLGAGEGFQSMRQLQQHMRQQHPALAADEARMQQLQDEEEDEDVVDEQSTAGPYMPLPPHLLDDVDDIDFDEQYLLG